MNTAQLPSRLLQLDVLRGIAILGILLLNIPSMGIIIAGYVDFSPALVSDQILQTINAFLFDGRFRSIFSLLFGIGLYIQYQKTLGFEGGDHLRIKSRLKWLLVFGILHCWFIWAGDILIIYALSGMFILKYIHLSSTDLLNKGFQFTVVGLIISLLEALLGIYFDDVGHLTRSSAAFLTYYQTIELGYVNYFIEQLFYTVANIVFFPIYMFYFSGVMLLGIGLYKSGVFSEGLTRRQLIQLTVLTIFVSAIDAYCRLVFPLEGFYLMMTFSSLSGLLMALLIVHWIVRCVNKCHALVQWLVQLLAQTGRVAFSLYILQSLVMVSLFRFIQPELLLTVSRVDYLLVAIIYTVFQLLLVHSYFKFFTIGPLETIWRKVTKKPRVRVDSLIQ